MIKTTLLPIFMTCSAGFVEFGKTCTAVASKTLQLLMITIEHPAGNFMVKWWFLFCIMALQARLVILRIAIVAALAVLMRFFFDGDFVLAFVMTAVACFVFVAVDTFQPILIVVRIVMEGDDGIILLRFINHFGKNRFGKLAHLENQRSGRQRFFAFFNMAFFTVRFVAPLFMATQTLPVIGTLQSDDCQIFPFCRRLVAIDAGEDITRWIVVMAGCAAPRGKCRHFSVQFVFENRSFIVLHQRIDFNQRFNFICWPPQR